MQTDEDYNAQYAKVPPDRSGLPTTSRRVLEVESQASGLRYACRQIHKSELPAAATPEAVAEHLATVSNLEHPHLCKLVEYFEFEQEYLLVYEKGCSPLLLDFLAARSASATAKMDPQDAAEVVRQLLAALAHAQRQGVVHGRIDPSALLLAARDGGGPRNGLPPQVKLGSMGLGYVMLEPFGKELRLAQTSSRRVAVTDISTGSLACAAPENCEPAHDHGHGHSHGPASQAPQPHLKMLAADATDQTEGATEPRKLWDRTDVWAVGTIAFQLLVGFPPFAPGQDDAPAADPAAQHRASTVLGDRIRTEGAAFDEMAWGPIPERAREVVVSMLQLNAKLRPTAGVLLKTKWLKMTRDKIPWASLRNLYRNAMLNVREGQFKKLVARVIAEQLPGDSQHVQDVAAAFLALDKDHDGLLDVAEFLEGLRRFPDLGHCVPDPVSLFEAMDRDGSQYLNAMEVVAATLPPSTARDTKALWNAFRAFDRNGDGLLTVDEVVGTARLLEGHLLSSAQMDELTEVIGAELTGLKIAGSEEEAAADVPEGVWKLFRSRQYRPIDFEEFFYLCAAREKHGLCGNIMQKELYRLVNYAGEVDLHNVRRLHDAPPWPPKDRTVAKGARSIHQPRGGLVGAREKEADSKRRKKSRSSRREPGAEGREGREARDVAGG